MDDLNNVVVIVWVLVIGVINWLDLLDFVLRCVGRFDWEICLGILGEVFRERIF